jgi:hypothetical protein
MVATEPPLARLSAATFTTDPLDRPVG